MSDVGRIVQLSVSNGGVPKRAVQDARVTALGLEGDTIRVEVEVVDKRETKKTDRGIVTYRHRVLNQRDELVLEARVQRMIKRR